MYHRRCSMPAPVGGDAAAARCRGRYSVRAGNNRNEFYGGECCGAAPFARCAEGMFSRSALRPGVVNIQRSMRLPPAQGGGRGAVTTR